MKIKFLNICLLLTIFVFSTGFTIDNFDTYEKEYETEEIEGCENTSVKTYMPYQSITNVNSKQYRYIQEYMHVDDLTGFLYDEDGFIGVALASYFGDIGSRYYFTLETGAIIPVVKVDAKSDLHTNGCTAHNGHLIEFVIDTKIAGDYFGVAPNGLVQYGNYNNDERFAGKIIKFEKVLDKKIEKETLFLEKGELDPQKNIIMINELYFFGGY